MRRDGTAVALAFASFLVACEEDSALGVEFFDVGAESHVAERGDELHTFSWSEARTIRRIARDTAAEVRAYLPGLPARLYLRVHPSAALVRASQTSSRVVT